MGPIEVVGATALVAVIIGWLVVSFLPEGRGRALLGRLSSAALYLALASLFTNLTQNAWAADRWMLWIPFGFLWLVFIVGFCLSLIKWIGELRGGGGASAHATH